MYGLLDSALTELEPANRALFHAMGGIYKMVDYLSPVGPQAPYATHIARTLPCVMDAEGRALFAEYATEADALGTTRIYVHGEGHGTYTSFKKRMIGANKHTIKFDSGETKTLKLKEMEWAVKDSDIDRLLLHCNGAGVQEPRIWMR